MPRKKTRGSRARPPVHPPTAVGTVPPGAPGAPTRRRIVCFTGGDLVGKSTIAAAAAWSWHRETGRRVQVLAAGAQAPLTHNVDASLERISESGDVFLEVPRSHHAFAEAIRRADVTFWVLSGDPFEAGVALGWLKHTRAIDGRASVRLVVNQADRDAPKGIEALLRDNGERPVASVPWDADANRLAPSESVEAAVRPIIGELRRALTGSAGDASEEQLAMTAAKQLGVPYASRENRVLRTERSQGLERVIGERYAREHLVLPLFLDGKTLAVAMADPDDPTRLDDLRLISGWEIEPFVAAKGQLLEAIDEFYGPPRVEPDVIVFINAVLKQAVSEKATAIHLERHGERASLRFRVDGVLYERMPPPKELLPAIVARLKVLAGPEGRITMKVRERKLTLEVSTMPVVDGENVVIMIREG
ncbi:MAG: hypothetical protein HY553_14995 [Elusimicrobia bacterium]|nr:hypothetical protein [Elusimicrobiota bacterium]